MILYPGLSVVVAAAEGTGHPWWTPLFFIFWFLLFTYPLWYVVAVLVLFASIRRKQREEREAVQGIIERARRAKEERESQATS